MDRRAVTRSTQLLDLARSVPLGIHYPLESSLLLTIAIRHFDASAIIKGWIAAAAGIGLIVAPMLTSLARHLRVPVMRIAAAMSTIGALGFCVAAFDHQRAFVFGSIVGVAALAATIPMLTVTYERNFPARERGRRVGWGMSVKVAVSAVAGAALGRFLSGNPAQWWLVVLSGAVAMSIISLVNDRFPSAPLESVPGVRNRLWPHFHLLAEDRRLRLTLAAWMLMGFGNLMLLPLRVEFLAKPTYGVNASATKIAVLTVSIPAVVRLIAMPIFGHLFDHLSFFASRITVNLLFAAYVAAFFTGTADTGLVIGAILFGVGSAGGDLMWYLWVTKFAPPGRVADYMGLHTFFTGIRAVLAPLLAFIVVGHLGLHPVAWITVSLMVASSLILLPEARAERQLATRPA